MYLLLIFKGYDGFNLRKEFWAHDFEYEQTAAVKYIDKKNIRF